MDGISVVVGGVGAAATGIGVVVKGGIVVAFIFGINSSSSEDSKSDL